MKKNIKICLTFIALALLISITLVQAYASPTATSFVGVELKADKSHYKSAWRTKTNEIYQHYHHAGSSTSWTPDCTDCKVAVDLYDDLGKIVTIITVKDDYTKMRDSFNKGDYYVELWRYNPGLIKTKHSGTWYISAER